MERGAAAAPGAAGEMEIPQELCVGFIGAGRMASAVARGMLQAGKVQPVNIFASAPSNTNLDKFQSFGCSTTHCNAEVLKSCTVVFLATKPHIVPVVLREIAPDVTQDHIVVSMAAGITLQTLEELLPAGTKVLRVIPSLPCMVQSGAIVLARGTCAGDRDAALLKRLLSPCGLCEEAPESHIDIHTGLSGSGVAY
ncbi:UNVERIFIED_CONTAM: Pyrroline-5-carboxylate reductase 3, partial [Gekko kuhli]